MSRRKRQLHAQRVIEPVPLMSFSTYRNRPFRTGLDIMDTFREAAWVLGYMLSRLLRLRVRTSNPLLIALMLLAASGLMGAFLAGFILSDNGLYLMVTGLCFAPIGLLLLLNAAASISGFIRAG